jgi:hypothetical protein
MTNFALYRDTSSQILPLEHNWGLTSKKLVKLKLAYGNLPLEAKVQIRPAVFKLNNTNKHIMRVYYTFLTNEGKYRFLDSFKYGI